MRARVCLNVLLALLIFWVCIDPIRFSLADNGKEESRIKVLVLDEIRQGILQKSPDLYLKSYLSTATVFSFQAGPVDTNRYRQILVKYFDTVVPETVECQFQSLQINGDRASMKVRFIEKGKYVDGADYTEIFTRYYRLIRIGENWKIETDGYNKSIQRIQRMHEKPTGAQ